MAAHVEGAAAGGPRYNPLQSETDRQSFENGIWLCEQCAALIDKNGGADYSVETLKLWKRASEAAALERLRQGSISLRDRSLRTLIYINVPRLHHFAELTDQTERLLDYFGDGIPSGEFIADKLAQFRRVLVRYQYEALDWSDAISLVDDPTGMLVRFEGNFRTKNGPKSPDDRSTRDLSDPEKSPHVYQKQAQNRLVLPYDPRFVTTNTAFVEFSSGTVRLGGFAQVKSFDGGVVVASPLFIGLTPTEEGAAFMDALFGR